MTKDAEQPKFAAVQLGGRWHVRLSDGSVEGPFPDQAAAQEAVEFMAQPFPAGKLPLLRSVKETKV